MAERMMYEPTEKQEAKWAKLTIPEMPSDEMFKELWKTAHHGKLAGWGMGKRDWVVKMLGQTREYQMGLWQGRVDALRGVDYSEDRNENTYNLGYYRGYSSFESDRKGMDKAQLAEFLAKYEVKEA